MVNETALDTMIQSYTDKVKANPDSLLFVQLADAYRKKGLLDKALEVVETGLARHPNLLSGLLMMGRIYSAGRQYAEAIEALRRVVQREPGNMTAHALLSQAYISLSRWTEAIAEYQKILSLNPEDAAAQAALRDALERLRRDRVATAGPSPAPSAAPSAAKPAAPPVAVQPGTVNAGAAPAPAGSPVKPTAPSSPPPPVRSDSPPEPAVVVKQPRAAAAPPMEAPAYAAAEELAARGLHDEAVEALQRILEADPDNYMARQKLREVYAQREAMESPSAGSVAAQAAAAAPVPGGAAVPAESQADKITDDEILYLLGLMEDTAPPAMPSPPPVAAPPKPAAVVKQPSVAAKPPRPEAAVVPVPVAAEPAPMPPPPAPPPPPPEPTPPPPEPTPAVAAEEPSLPVQEGMSEALKAKVTVILDRLASTEGLRQAYFVSEHAIVTSGEAPAADQSAKIVTLVNMVADLTRRAASSMKQGDVKQVLVFGTDGLVMVSPAKAGVLAAVAGGGVKVGLLRIALNDCLKRLAEVS